MAWCPKCKTEYRDGITTCADCGATLVEQLDESCDSCVARFEEKEVAEKFLEFLQYSEITTCELTFDSAEDRFQVLTTAAQLENATKLFETFKEMESKKDSAAVSEEAEIDPEQITFEEAEELSEEEHKDIPITKIMPDSSTTYVKKKDRYNDLRSTFWIFILFGIGGLVFVGLNVMNILNFFNNAFQYSVLSLVCFFFIFVAIKSLIDSKRIYKEIDLEQESTNTINAWLVENMTKEELAKFDDDTLAAEVIYLKKIEYMKTKLFEAFDIDNEAFAEELIEEYYNYHFE